MFREFRPAIVLFVALTVVTGVVYPLVITGVARVLFAERASGSVIEENGEDVGSRLIGQTFTEPRFFWGRLSATGPVPSTAFNATTLTGSSGSNLAPTNPALVDRAAERIAALRAGDASVGYERPADQRIPVDLVTASASGLDPHISIAAAEYQIGRVALARKLSEESVRALVHEHTRSRQLGLLGEPVVNVLELNLSLDRATNAQPPVR